MYVFVFCRIPEHISLVFVFCRILEHITLCARILPVRIYIFFLFSFFLLIRYQEGVQLLTRILLGIPAYA
jgi:hypothetical protein